MNKSMKKQLILLCILLVCVILILVGVKLYQANAKQETGEAESYQVTEIDTSLVREIGIITRETSVNLYKENDIWKCLEDSSIEIDSALVESFMQSAASITSDTKIEDVSDMKQYGLEEPAINVTLQWDNNMYVIKVGDYNSMIQKYYLCLDDASIVYTTDGILYNALNKTVDDFKVPDTQEEETTSVQGSEAEENTTE